MARRYPRDPETPVVPWLIAAGIGWGLAIWARYEWTPWSRSVAFSAALAMHAAVAVMVVEVVGALAGRGRGLPGARFAPIVRVLIVGLLVLWRGWGDHDALMFGDDLAGVVFTPLIFAALCEAFGRFRAPSLLLPFFVVEALTSVGGSAATLLAMVAMLLPLVVGGVWMLWRDRGRRSLAALGITPCAPSDLALVPATIGLWVTAARDRVVPGSYFDARRPEILATLLAAAALMAALVYFDRRLCAAEAGPAR